MNLDAEKISLLSKESNQIYPFIPNFQCSTRTGVLKIKGIIAIWDSGSTNSYISEGLIGLLQTRKIGQSKLNRRTLEGVSPVTVDLYDIEILSEKERYAFSGVFMSTKSIVTLPPMAWSPQGRAAKLDLAQEYPHSDLKVDLLFGIDLIGKVLLESIIKFDNFFAIKTHFGWTLAGYWQGNKSALSLGLLSEADTIEDKTTHLSNEDLDRRLESFWKVEHTGILGEHEDVLSVGERAAVTTLEHGRVFIENRYYLPLLWKSAARPRNNWSMAVKRLESLERRLKKDPETEALYHEEFRKLEQKGLIERVSLDRRFEASFLLPHRPIVKRDADGKILKVRPVFDAAARDSSGHKLNDFIWPGPPRQTDLCGILLRFRMGPYAISWDIQSMFHCFHTLEDDRDYQRFIYRYGNVEDAIIIYRAIMVCFGFCDSPFKCSDTLYYHCLKYTTTHPLTCAILIRNLFVDDELAAMMKVADVLLFVEEATYILAQAGMKLHKISTNSEEVKRGLLDKNINTDETVGIKGHEDLYEQLSVEDKSALGIQWNPKKDVFSFSGFAALDDGGPVTKRTISSKSASIFDPVGYLSPFLMRSKFILRQCWVEKAGWDDKSSPEIEAAWTAWLSELRDLDMVKIPRPIILDAEIVDMSLACFGDASMRGYCACVYLRVEYMSGLVTSNLIISKTKIAPTKVISLPRLELCAMLINCRLGNFVVKELDRGPLRATYFSDSKTCLNWVRKSSTNWKSFVANKVSEIQRISDVDRHRWVAGLQNPSDRGTRGESVQSMIGEDLWWHGPDWLINPEESWPKESFIGGIDEDKDALVEKAPAIVFAAVVIPEKAILEDLVVRFSEFTPIVNTIGFLNRLKKKARAARAAVLEGRSVPISHPRTPRPHLIKKSIQEVPKISGFEWIEAMNDIFRFTQKEHFGTEWDLLTKQPPEPVSASSPLSRFLPYFDADVNLIRIGGRLHESDLSEPAKHQILLPFKCELVRKFILHFHQRRCHEPNIWLISWLRQKVWILRTRKEVQTTKMRCLRCFKKKAEGAGQLMGAPPRPRVTLTRCFSTCAVDQAGPFWTRAKDGTKEKRWIVLYTCASSRGVILDVVESMDTPTFILSLRRFVARRGLPLEIWSDNHATLKKANRELLTLWRMLDKKMIESVEEFKHIQFHWEFIPPKAPHHGGWWERLIAVMKECLYGSLKGACLSDVELRTVILEVETLLNDRPLVGTESETDGSIEALTPNKLQFGNNLAPFPAISPRRSKGEVDPVRVRWRHRQALLKNFERKWSKLYLFELQKRNVWQFPKKDIEVGEIVLLKDSDAAPRALWPLARVIETSSGRDGRVRKVLLKVRGNELWRPIQNLYPLEIRGEADITVATPELLHVVDNFFKIK